jgi:hypothetical protein
VPAIAAVAAVVAVARVSSDKAAADLGQGLFTALNFSGLAAHLLDEDSILSLDIGVHFALMAAGIESLVM